MIEFCIFAAPIHQKVFKNLRTYIHLTHTRDGKGLYECWMFYIA